MQKIKIIVAVGNYVPNKGYPIGKSNKIPWHNSNDLRWFKECTVNHTVIMGRKTFESIGEPLKDRMNIVVTRNIGLTYPDPDNVIICHSLKEAVETAKELTKEDIFIIGGQSIFEEAFKYDIVDEVWMDMLSENCLDADTFFDFPNNNKDNRWITYGDTTMVEKSKAYAVTWMRNVQMNSVDKQYHDLLKEIIEKGVRKETRSGSVRSLFDRTMRFDLQDGLPLITTKKVFYKGIIHELLWFLKGDTDIKYLVDNNVHIWDDDAYRYYLECYDGEEGEPLTKEEFINGIKDGTVGGDLGPVYGSQWRSLGGRGFDQIQHIIDMLRTNPDDRRMVLSAWNVEDLGMMALPPCHMMAVFNTEVMTLEERRIAFMKMKRKGIEANKEDIKDEDGFLSEKYLDMVGFPVRRLNCSFLMRSNDFCAGNPYNIAQYGMLTYMLCEVCDMAPGELVYHGIDVHMYENHLEGALEQLERKGSGIIPKLRFKRKINDINDFKYEDFEIVDYKPDEPIKYQLNVGLEKIENK